MDREEALELLRAGNKGVEEWNRRHGVGTPNLSDANLSRANLIGAYLSDADLSRANLIGAYLSDADLSRANLSDADLSRAYLSRANLIGAYLSDANLSDADLSGANLSDADLSRADLSRADLSRADLIGAYLSDANLSDANLSDANLSRANLSRADLIGAYLSDADLSDVDLGDVGLGDTIFANVDLSQTRGLDQVTHFGPSTLGVDTLYRSQGKIPEVFLRGCGVPENLITYLPSLLGQPIQFYSCFISYSHSDNLFARRLYDTLQGRGIRCWLDEHQLLPGDNIYKGVEEGIRMWDKTLLCASEASLTSGWVDDEIKHAFAKEKKIFSKRGEEVLVLVPLNLDGYLFNGWEHPKKDLILERLAPDFTNWKTDHDQYETHVERVIKALALTREPPPVSKL